MGGNKSRQTTLKASEVVEFSKVSTFTCEEINDLYSYYRVFSMSQVDDGVIDFAEFCEALGCEDSRFI
jgi:hypothetical protein